MRIEPLVIFDDSGSLMMCSLRNVPKGSNSLDENVEPVNSPANRARLSHGR